MKDVLGQFETEMPFAGYSQSTVDSTVVLVRPWLAWMGGYAPEKLTRLAVMRFLDHLRTTPPQHRDRPQRTNSTVNGYLKSMRRFCRWLESIGELESDPTAGLHMLPEEDRIIIPPTPEEVLRVLETARRYGSTEEMRRRNLLLISMLIDIGPRIRELQGLSLGDVVKDDKIRSQVILLGKGGRERVVAINAAVEMALIPYLEVRRPLPGENALFLSQDGSRMSYVAAKSANTRICKAAGVKAHLHAFRHFAHTQMYLSKIGQLSGMALSGHSDSRSYLRYVRSGVAGRALEDHREMSPLRTLSG